MSQPSQQDSISHNEALETPPTSGNNPLTTDAAFYSTPARQAAVDVLDLTMQSPTSINEQQPAETDQLHVFDTACYVESDDELDMGAMFYGADDDDETECSQSELILALSQSSTTELDCSQECYSSTSVTTEPTRNVVLPRAYGESSPQSSQDGLLPPSSAMGEVRSPSVAHVGSRSDPPSPNNHNPTASPQSPPQQTSGVGGSSSSVSIPMSATLFRYIRSALGRSNDATTVAVTATPSVDDGVASNAVEYTSSEGEMDEDDEEDQESLYEEESWGEADSMEDLSMSTREYTLRNSATKMEVYWNRLPVLPNRFCVAVPTKMNAPPPYLDNSLLQKAGSLTGHEANEFAWEHGVLLQAVLQLLAERDQVGVEGSMDNTDNIWKKGPLKKMSFAVGRRKNQRPAVAGAWKVKYVELRQGNLCYYEDSIRTGRKTIHLRQADTVVQESFDRGPGFVFELLVQGSPTRYWMASSEKEREEWIRAIQSAMIGDDAPRKDLDLSPYTRSLEIYLSLREALQKADSQETYLAPIQEAMKTTASLQVPVQWVRDKIENDLSPLLLGTLKPPKYWRSPQQQLKSSISDFWKSMGQTTFSINGLTVSRKSQLASERIVGALTRCILEFDKAFWVAAEAEQHDGDNDIFLSEAAQISELQAVSYSRNILLNVLRSRERQDTACAVRYLLENHGVTVIEEHRSSSGGSAGSTVGMDEPVHMEVSFAGEDLPDEFLPDTDEMATWVWIKRRRRVNSSSIAGAVASKASVATSKRKQRHTFAVLSGSVLSYYAASTPRPHGLHGQLVLTAATFVDDEGMETVYESNSDNVSTSAQKKKQRYVLCIAQEGRQDWLLSFEKEEDCTAWKEALQLSIDSAGSIQNPPRVVTTTTTTPLAVPAMMLVKGAERAIDGTINGGIRVIKGAKDQGIRVVKGAKDGGMKLIKTTAGSGFKVIRGAVGMLRQNKSDEGRGLGRKHPSMKMLLNSTDIVHGKREPSVQCVVQTLQSFMIKEQGYTEHGSEGTTSQSAEDDGWISVQAKLYQAFLMAGGPSGRISVGDALVELEFVETNVADDDVSVE